MYALRRYLSTSLRSIPQKYTQQLPVTPSPPHSLQAKSVQAFIHSFTQKLPIGIALLHPSVFAAPIRIDILHKCIVHHLSLLRGVVYRTELSRSEVQGSGKKVRPQKRSGRARMSTKKSPLSRKNRIGPYAFPRKVRDYRIKLNKKVKDLGMRVALSSKYNQNQLVLVKDFEIKKDVMEAGVSKLGLRDFGGKILFVFASDKEVGQFLESGVKGRKVRGVTVEKLSVYDVLCYDYLVVRKSALVELEKVYRCY